MRDAWSLPPQAPTYARVDGQPSRGEMRANLEGDGVIMAIIVKLVDVLQRMETHPTSQTEPRTSCVGLPLR